MAYLRMSCLVLRSAILMVFTVVSSLRYLDEASLKSDVLPRSVERATRSAATILVWEDHKWLERIFTLFMSECGLGICTDITIGRMGFTDIQVSGVAKTHRGKRLPMYL